MEFLAKDTWHEIKTKHKMSLIHDITRRVRELPPVETADDSFFQPGPAALPPTPLNTIEISRHHPSDGYLAVFAGDRGIGATLLEALGRLVEAGVFGQFHLLDLT